MSATLNTELGAVPMLGAIRVPQHVVYRRLVNETVMLNVMTGRYHGLNETGAHILDALQDTSDPEAAIPQLAKELDVDEDLLRADVARFCEDLLARGLIEKAA